MTQFDSYKDEEQGTNHTQALIGMGVGFFILAFALIWLSFKVNSQMIEIRSNFWLYLKRGLLALLLLTCLISFVFIVLNSMGKKKRYDENWIKDEEKTKEEKEEKKHI